MSASTVTPTNPGASAASPATSGARAVLAPRSWRATITYAVVAGLLGVLAASLDGAVRSGFRFSSPSDAVTLPSVAAPSRGLLVVLAILVALAAIYAGYRAWHRASAGTWLAICVGLFAVTGFIAWAIAGKGGQIVVTGLLNSALVLSLALIFGSLAGVLCERSGVINIAIEGQLLAGAFLGAVVGTLTGSAVLGMIAAPLAGVAVAALLALFAIAYKVDHIIVGVVLNVLVIGVTSFLYSTVLADNPAQLNSPRSLPVVAIPLLSDIPVLGPVLFRQTILVYVMYVVVAVLQVMVFRSRWGLRMRAVGEHPKAADTVGINVNLTRWKSTLLGGAVAGLGGAAFTVGAGLAFGKEMTAGKGFIALAAMILGRWSPKGALAAALLFGFADALRLNLGVLGSDVPSQFLGMLPYLATIFAVAGLVGRVRAPAAEGIAYEK